MNIYERVKLICDLSELIADSKIYIPEQYEEKYLTKTGNSKIIAEAWVNNYKNHFLPLKIIRTIRGVKQIISPETLIFIEDENIFNNYSISNNYFNNNFQNL